MLKNCQSDPGTYHGYGIQDLLQSEPGFASLPGKAEDELRALVDEAHALGLYVIHKDGEQFRVLNDSDLTVPGLVPALRREDSEQKPQDNADNGPPFYVGNLNDPVSRFMNWAPLAACSVCRDFR